MFQTETSSFGFFRSIFWPIHKHELRKLVPMMLMLFFICFNYNILRNMKDSVVISASGAEVIPFIKFWAMLPGAVLLTFIFTKLSNRFSQERVFYIMTTSFLFFYCLFAFVLYPCRDIVHPNALADVVEGFLPFGGKWMVALFRNWSFTIFYVLSELWGVIVLNVMFWGFANEITRIHEARRFYSLLGIGSNVAAIFAGQTANFFSSSGVYNPNNPLGRDAWEQTQMMLILLITVTSIFIMLVFRWLNKKELTDSRYDELHLNKKQLKSKGKLSMKETFTYLSNSKYLVCIAILVVGYNLVISMAEVVWKAKLAVLYSTPSDINTYMNNLTSAIGIIATIAAIFMPKLITKFGWTSTAMITPVILFITCLGFFSFLIFGDYFGNTTFALIGTSPLVIVVFFGAIQNCFSKAAKYSVFDATKEMAYIPLSHECKLKGKAAIDGIGSRFGKSGGSIIHQGLLMVFETLAISTPYVGGILMLVIVIWMSAVRSLGKQFNALVSEEKSEPVPLNKPTTDNQPITEISSTSEIPALS